MRHIVMFSGGAASWAAAKRVVYQHGAEGNAALDLEDGDDVDLGLLPAGQAAGKR